MRYIVLLWGVACTPGYVKLDGVTTDDVNDTTDTNDITDTTDTSDTTDTTNTTTDDTIRCCYTISMFDTFDDGWDRGMLDVYVDDGLYAEITLLPGGDGFREVCPAEGSVLQFYWNPSMYNQEVSLSISDANGDMIYRGSAPDPGLLVGVDSTCSVDQSVDASYQEEESNTTDLVSDTPTDPNDPNDPHGNPDSADIFAGDYFGYFMLVNQQNGFQVCENQMPVSVDSNGNIIADGDCTTSNGYQLFFTHEASIDMNSAGGIGGGPGGGPGQIQVMASGQASMTVPSGDTFYAPLYGECVADRQYVYMILYWDMTVQTPTETRLYSGQLFVQ